MDSVTHALLMEPVTTRGSYRARVLGISPANLVAYYPMHDCIPGGACTDASGNAFHGTYGSAVSRIAGGMDGLSACYCIGAANSLVELYGAGLGAAFPISGGTVMVWVKTVWAKNYKTYFTARTDASNYIYLRHSSSTTIAQVEWHWVAGGTDKLQTVNSPTARDGSLTGWIQLAATWINGGNFLCYFDGKLVSTGTSGGTWSGAPSVVRVGSSESPGNYFTGSIAHVAIWNTQLSGDQIRSLSR